MRKSDHRNAIRSHEHFDALCASAGLEVAERRYYNVVFKAVVEDLRPAALRAVARGRGAKTAAAHDRGTPARARRARSGAAPSRGRRLLAIGPRRSTWLLKLDVVLFGGIRTGPVLRPAASPPRARVRILYVASDQAVPGRTGGSVHVLEVARGLARARPRGRTRWSPPTAGAPREERRGRASGTASRWRPRHRLFRFRARRAVEAHRATRCGRRW